MPVSQDGLVTDPTDYPSFDSEGPASIIGPATSSPEEPLSPSEAPSPRSGTTSPGAPEVPESKPEFDPRFRDAFTGLLYVGDLQDEFSWGGHKIRIRTIHPDEYKAVASLHAQFAGTIGDVRAYADAIVAACIISVDGKPLPITPLGPPENTLERVRAAYDYISAHWYSWTIDAIYDRFRVLEGKVEEILEALGN